MPVAKSVEEIDKEYNLRPFIEAPVTKSSEVDASQIIELDSIDLNLFKFGDEFLDERKKLATKLEKSLSTVGFVSLINHGIPHEEIEHLRSVAQSVLELPQETKVQYLAGAMKSDLEDRSVSLGAERGAGFKPKGYWSMKKGVEDSIELYNFRDMLQPKEFYGKRYPEIVKAHLKEVENYFSKLHEQVLYKLTILCDLILELPEGYLYENYFKVIKGDLQNSGGGFGRFMVYHEMDPNDSVKVDKNWLRGHSDGTAFTFITSQPILSLQIRDYYNGQWKYVGHVPNGLIVNIGDAMEFITGGYFKSSIHRVVAPPSDQQQYKRLVIIYFNQPRQTCYLDPEHLNSPRLQKLGLHNSPKEWQRITFKDWDEEKGRLFGKKKVNDANGDEPNLVLVYGRLHERWHQAEQNFNLQEARKRFNIIEV